MSQSLSLRLKMVPDVEIKSSQLSENAQFLSDL